MKTLILHILVFVSFLSFGQKDNVHIREGNKKYEKGDFAAAKEDYMKAIEINPNRFASAFNLGDALFKEEKFEEAAKQFGIISESTSDKTQKSKAYHNMGNAFLKAEKLEESIKAYKNALKYNPKDEETRYNLQYALNKLQKQQQQQQKDQKQDQQEQNKDQKEKDKQEQQNQQNQDKQDQQQQQQPDKQKEGQPEQQQPQPKKGQLSKEEAKQMLEAMQNEEKNVQDKLKQKRVGPKVKSDKDW